MSETLHSGPVATGTPTRRRGAWAAGVLVLAGVIALGAWRGEARHFEEMVRRARPAWLLLAVALQGGTYVCAAAVWQRALAREGEPRTLRSLVPLGLAKLFTDQVVPSAGVSGTVLVVHALDRRGVPPGASTGAVLVSLLSYYVAYAIALAATLGVLWWLGDLSRVVLALAGLFAVLSAAVAGALFWLDRRHRKPLPAWVVGLPVAGAFLEGLDTATPGILRDRTLLAEAVLFQLGIFALDSATLWTVLRAVGWPAGPARVAASFVMASVAGTLGIVPGGLGTFEAACVAMLHAVDVPVAVALTATLLLRGFTFWLPMIPGMWLAHRAVR